MMAWSFELCGTRDNASVSKYVIDASGVKVVVRHLDIIIRLLGMLINEDFMVADECISKLPEGEYMQPLENALPPSPGIINQDNAWEYYTAVFKDDLYAQVMVMGQGLRIS